MLMVVSGVTALCVNRAMAEECSHGGAGALVCQGDFLDIVPGTDTVPANLGPGSLSNKRYVPYQRLSTAPDGSACMTTAWREVTDPTVGDSLFGLTDQETGNIFANYPPCPESNAVPQDPTVIAARYWEEIPLPKPQPYIAPGWAITGKLAYMETNGELRHTYTNSTPVGPLEIVATGAYYVDWGDGESSGPHAREGKPWPEGEITHEYVWAKAYDIVVTERWTATWSLGGKSGTLRELRTSGTIDDFPARQIQAVIRS